MQRPRVVTIVGAGFCGTVLAVHLARAGGFAVALIDRSGRFGPGLAYGAARPIHLLNTPAGRMSAFPEDPDHFTRWARTRDPAVGGGSFLPRPLYGEYLRALLAGAGPVTACSPGQVRTDMPGVTCLTGQVVEVGDGGVALADGGRLAADAVVLCPGNPAPSMLPVPPELREHPAHIADPWGFDPAVIDRDAPALVIGSGLTGLDIALLLAQAGHRGPIHLASRHGLLPQPHRVHARPRQHPQPAVDAWPATARGMLAGLRREVEAAEAEGIDWREVVASLRPVTPVLWQRLPLDEQARFLRHLRAYWDSHRHRAAPETHRAFTDLQAAARLHVHAGRIAAVTAAGPRLRVTLRRAAASRTLEVGALINCTGPASDLRGTPDPLLRGLLAGGRAQVDPLALGLVTEDDGRLPGAGVPLFLAGPLRRPRLWEATAVLELADQIAALAATLARAP
jgi:uncharacterized NAD(P)/FAD-binding protein YdhS